MTGRRVVLVVVLLGVVATIAYLSTRPAEVEVVRPTRGPVVQTVVSSGRVMPPAEIKLGALTASTVREVFVGEGDAVVVDQLLVQLDDGEAKAAVDRARAGVAAAKAGRFEVAKLGAPAAEAALRQADASLEQAKRDLERKEELFAGGVIPKANLDDARTALELAESQRAAAGLQVQAASAGGSQALSAAAAVAQAEAQLALAEEQLARTKLQSPVDGTVLARYLEPGDAVVAGSTLLILARTGATRLVIEPDERNLATLALGQPATASAEAFPDLQFAASVQYIAPSVDPQRGTVEVRLAVPSPPPELKPHMTVSVEIEVGKRDGVLTLPRSAVRDLASREPFVMAVVDGRAVRRAVELGILGDERVEIRAGIDEGSLVVASEGRGVAEGDRVRGVER
ncbi:MAG: efflux RND transporter periplasmic adaptor subunit [Myxococcales bacterium]|nr:efflux RND transporter periplasmic adaptor subunit [Myxococcales bacterium]